MLYKTRGVVFKTIRFSETSVVSKIYTERFGLQSYIINGVRSAKAKVKASLLQSLSLLEMEVYHRENRNLNRIKELQAAVVFSSIPFDLMKGAVGLFMIEILYKSIREEEANTSLFNFIFSKINTLDKEGSPGGDYLLKFLLELSAHLGFFPNGQYTVQTPQFDIREGSFVSEGGNPMYLLDANQSNHLFSLIQEERVVLPSPDRKKLLESLLQYYQLHVPGFTRPKSLRVLEEVFR